MWGACTRAGAGGRPTHEHLDYYLDEFTFRFNRRRSRSRGKLFFRLVQQAVAIVSSASTMSCARSSPRTYAFRAITNSSSKV